MSTEPAFTVADALLEEFGEGWHECVAFRFQRDPKDPSIVIFEATNDLERITAPESSDA